MRRGENRETAEEPRRNANVWLRPTVHLVYPLSSCLAGVLSSLMTQSHLPSNAQQMAPLHQKIPHTRTKKTKKKTRRDEREAATWMKEDGGRDAAVLGRGLSVSPSLALSSLSPSFFFFSISASRRSRVCSLPLPPLLSDGIKPGCSSSGYRESVGALARGPPAPRHFHFKASSFYLFNSI